MKEPTEEADRGRRHENRYPVLIGARVQVPLIDLGRATLKTEASIEELSLHGARVFIPSLETKQLSVLTRLRNRFSLIYRLPEAKTRSYLWGEIVWLDIRPGSPSSSVRLGIDLREMLPTERFQLEQFLEALAKEGSAGVPR